MKILLFGQNGQLGWELQRSLTPLGEITALTPDSQTLCGDFINLQGIRDTVRQIQPDIIVNAAAYTLVDKAESEPELVATINTKAPQVLAQEAAEIGAWFVHYSTDYVFDGSGVTPWQESDSTAPLNVYGATKLASEEAIIASGCQYLIFRTSWLYAVRGQNFAKTLLNLANQKENLTVVSDQYGAPTGAELLADISAHALRQAIAEPQLAGLYHLVASGITTWYEYACFVIDHAHKLGIDMTLTAEHIRPVPTSQYPTPARRPLNSRLNTHKFQRSFKLTLPAWQQGVARMLTEMIEKS